MSVLNGSFLSSPHISQTIFHFEGISYTTHILPQWYYPGSSEVINAVFILLHIPTLSNIFATLLLSVVLWKLALTFRLSKHYALLFALAFTTLNVMLRWLNAVSIDIWIGVWFALSIILLERPRKSVFYFAQLGFVLGMLIGSKYTAWFFLPALILFYAKDLYRSINLVRVLAFLVPFSIFGLFWYIRNYLLTHDPFYPLSVLGFKGLGYFSDSHNSIWNITLHHPFTMFNAGYGEYKLWIFSVLVAIGVLLYEYVIKKNYRMSNTNKLFFIGLLNFLSFLQFPTDAHVWIMVSSFRYSFPAFIPLMLGVFLLASKYKKEELLGYVTIASMINVLTMAYYPKLVLVFLPLTLVIVYLLQGGSIKAGKA